MPQYKYLIVGGGMTADATVQGIRKVDGARQLIAEAGRFAPEDLKGRLLEVPQHV